MDHSQRGTNTDASNGNSASFSLMSNVLFREIHKNAFLKRHSSDRRTGFPRKSERVWVVFCVHDDVEPFLEIYPDQKVALTHKPEWFASLSNVLHVSSTICGHEDEFEFAITLPFQVVRLLAPSWDSMIEWVETLRNKLRELKVLCPKENIYSKMPEQKQPLLPTRDPNSPLPLPPEGPSTLLPGVELVHVESRNNPNPSAGENSESGRIQRNLHFRNDNERRGINRRINHIERITRSVTEPPSASCSNGEDGGNQEENPSSKNLQLNKIKVSRAASLSQASTSTNIPTPSNITVIEVSTSHRGNSEYNTSVDNIDNDEDDDDDDDVFVTPSVSQKSDAETDSNQQEAHYEHVFLPSIPAAKNKIIKTSVNCLQFEASSKIHTSVLISPNSNSSHDENGVSTSCINVVTNSDAHSACINIHSAAEAGNSQINPLSSQIQSKLEKVNITGLIPRVPAKSSKVNAFKAVPIVAESSEGESSVAPITEDSGVKVINGECSRATEVEVTPSYSQVKKVHKGKVKVDDEQQRGSPLFPRRKMTNIQVEGESQGSKKPEFKKGDVKVGQKVLGCKKECGSCNAPAVSVSSSGIDNWNADVSSPSTSGNRIEKVTKINVTKKDSVNTPEPQVEPITATVQPAVSVISVEDIPLIGGHQRRRRRSSSSDAAAASIPPSSRAIGGADRIRINVPNLGHGQNEAGHARNLEQSPQAAPQSSRLTLREQQVLQLKKEMLHPGGVRLQLRRKDCTGSIALVDVLNGVWVAGWKQKEHPLLYNALHIGDQLISVGDALVRSSAEAHKLIRTSTSLYVEFIIRRVPFGNVFALQRSSEGQNLGIVQEGNTAEIKDIVPNSVAARNGLTAKTPSCDGLSLTTCFITEINGRPLNLFFKDNEVKDRLNAVGKEISILVQPFDFIKQIKKQLKSIRSYKDYIVQ